MIDAMPQAEPMIQLAPQAAMLEEPIEDKADPSAEEFITGWLKKIDAAKEHHKDAFDRMREDILFAAGVQWPGQTQNDDRYVADITQNIIRQRVAALYAKNPTVVAHRRKRQDFQVWDENVSTLQQAMADPMNPQNMMLLQDVMQGAQRRQILNGVSKTLEIIFHQQLGEQQPDFKRQMKQLVRRVETTGVGYLRLDFHRAMDVNPSLQAQINDYATQLSQIEAMIAAQEKGDFAEHDQEAERLRVAIKALEEQKYILIREGLLVSFPRSTALIPDENCTQLEGFMGARWIAEEFFMSGDEVQRLYKKDPKDYAGDVYTPEFGEGHKYGASKMVKKDSKGQGFYCVYLIHDLDTSSCFTIMRGCREYMKEPTAPTVQLERFFPYFALTFNDREDENCIFPHSTVRLMRHQQLEYNRSKEALRQHRIASRPLYASATGAIPEEDKRNMAEHKAHECIELQGLQENQSVDTKFQMVKKHPIDQNVYETQSIFADIGRVVGVQAADLGATSGVTATESSLAEDSRVSGIASNADDLDDFLTAFVKEGGKVILLNFSAETVKKIAGPGAVWPEFSAEEIVNDLYLEIEAGSSGRPNKAAKAAAVQRLYPLLVQLPGVNPEWVVKMVVDLMDDTVDISDAYLAGMPSIMTLNKSAGMGGQPSTGNPQTDPGAQGGAGADNSPAPDKPQGGPQAGMPQATTMEQAPQREGGILGSLMGMLKR